jgi:hypothetical protein
VPTPAKAQVNNPSLRRNDSAFEQQLRNLQAERQQLERQIPESIFGMIGSDEDPHDVRVHIRGNHKNLGEVAPRRFLQIIAGEKQAAVSVGSGRLQLAESMVRPENPLTARVMVNRIWKHHFGQGIVRSVDNFGKTGEAPTHPELLDFLSQRFIESGWSVKAMHRMMVLSSTYAMSSQPEPEAEKLDPENKLLHRMPLQRLEAESIRDAILAVAVVSIRSCWDRASLHTSALIRTGVESRSQVLWMATDGEVSTSRYAATS